MANTNPDIELVVGVDSGNSYTTMKDGINQVLRDIESRDPPKIKIHLDDTEINSKLQTLRSQIAALSENKISINIAGATQGVEKTIKSAISNYEQAYYFVNNELNSSKATEQLERIKSSLKENAGLAKEFYAALSHSYSANNVSQLVSTFRSLCKEESDATSAAQQFRDIIRQQFEITVPEMEKFNQRGFESLAVLKKFDKAMGGAGKYTGREFFDWLESSATKAQKALFDCEHGLNIVQGALKQLNDDAHTGLFVGYSDRLGEDSITLNQDGMKRLSASAKSFKDIIDSSNQSLSNLRQVLTSVFNINPQSFESGGVAVTLQQLQQIIDQAPHAKNLIGMITHGFDRAYIPPHTQQITQYLNNVEVAEQSLQTQTERLGETMNSSITSDAFNSKLVAINESIGQVSGSISTLAENISSALNKSVDNTMLNVNPDALKVVEELLRGIYNIANGIDMSKVINEISKVGDAARSVKAETNTIKKLDFSVETTKFQADMDLIQRDFDRLKGSTLTLAINLGELHTAFTTLESGSSTQEQRVAAYEKLKALIPVVRQQIKVQANEEKAAMQANNKAIREATLESKKQNAIEEKANTQRRIALDLLAKITKAQQEWTKAQNGKTSNEYAQLQNYSNQLTTLLNQLANYSMPKANFTAQVKSINDEFVRTSSVIRSAGEDTKSLKDRFGALTGTFSMWFSTTRIIMMVYSNIRKMISASIELDKSMTQLQIVTKENDETMTKFGNTAADTARKIGSSITDFTSSVTTFARLGYSIGESSQLAEFTAMLQNVGDIDVAEAQEAITSIVKAFNIGTDQIESVMDKMVVSGNQFPISVSEIAVGMKNASSALAAAGNSFDQSVALLTAANTTINLCRVA